MEPKHLTELELVQIELGEQKSYVESLKVEIAKLRQGNIQLKAKNFELIGQLKQYEIKEAEEALTAKRKLHTEFMNELKKKYEIEDQAWGYDPTTGEIEVNPRR
jgi:hypothetical protein